MTPADIQFSCVRSVYALRYACLRRDWKSVKTELAWAQKNGAAVNAEALPGAVRIEVILGEKNFKDTITDLDPREAAQIIESLLECGITIREVIINEQRNRHKARRPRRFAGHTQHRAP